MAKVYEYIPSAYKTGATAAIIPNREEASVTRTSDGYSENADGTLELKGANETRYYYDNGVRKILIEDSATNNISTNFNDWNLSNVENSLGQNNSFDSGIEDLAGSTEAISINFRNLTTAGIFKYL